MSCSSDGRKGLSCGLVAAVCIAGALVGAGFGFLAGVGYVLPRGPETQPNPDGPAPPDVVAVGLVVGLLAGALAGFIWCRAMSRRILAGRTAGSASVGTGVAVGMGATVVLHSVLSLVSGTAQVWLLAVGSICGLVAGAIVGAVCGPICRWAAARSCATSSQPESVRERQAE